ncbi:MAG: DoxX family protein [Deltaproteobacteria bacterium]|nr:DoxX family protein [Deltaproteobacteria bacterium]
MDDALTVAVETLLRITLGLRFLYSGLSNVRRWPNAVENARLVFPFGQTFFGFIAVLLMVGGGIGLTVGLMTRVAAFMIVLFLIPTLKIQWHWLRTLPVTIEEVNNAVPQEEIKKKIQLLARQAYHSHETGWQNNFLFLVVALFYCVRGATALGLDTWLR